MLVSVYMWNQAPFATLLFLAGMQSISEDLYSAGRGGRGGLLAALWYVTLPALRPIVFLVLVLATVNGFLMLDLIYVLTMGGPGNDTTTVSWLGFKTSFRSSSSARARPSCTPLPRCACSSPSSITGSSLPGSSRRPEVLAATSGAIAAATTGALAGRH